MFSPCVRMLALGLARMPQHWHHRPWHHHPMPYAALVRPMRQCCAIVGEGSRREIITARVSIQHQVVVPNAYV